MTVIIDKYPIDTDIFKGCAINERLHMAYFISKPVGMEGEITLPVLFESLEDTRIFFDGYCNALYSNESIYEFRGEAWFSLELYIRLRDGAGNNIRPGFTLLSRQP